MITVEVDLGEFTRLIREQNEFGGLNPLTLRQCAAASANRAFFWNELHEKFFAHVAATALFLEDDSFEDGIYVIHQSPTLQ